MKFISKLFLVSTAAVTFFCTSSKAADFGLAQRRERVESLKEVGQEMVKEAVNLGIISFIIGSFNRQTGCSTNSPWSFKKLCSDFNACIHEDKIATILSSILLTYYIYRNGVIIKKYISSKKG